MDSMMMPPMEMPPMGMPPAPSPFASMPPAAPPPIDLDAIIRDVVKQKKPKPVIPPGWKKPVRPDYGWVQAEAARRWTNGQAWRALVATMISWTRQDLTGGFERDARSRQTHADEEWISTELSDERNLMIAKGATLTPSFYVPLTAGEARGAAQRMEDAAHRLWEERKARHARSGNRPLEIDQWTLFVDYGLYTSRTTCFLKDPGYPLDHQLVDPASVYPTWDGRNGLKDVIRKYKDTLYEIESAYGTLADEVKTDIKAKLGGKKLDGDTELEVIEYWNTWDRCVLVNGVAALPWVSHEYYKVPFTVQYGGYGEPLFTRDADTGMWGYAPDWSSFINGYIGAGNDRFYKATPALFYRLKGHRQFEAIMSRFVTAFRIQTNPAYIRFRTNAAAEGKDLEPLDLSEGAVNDAIKGEEELQQLMMGSGSFGDTLLQAATMDRQSGSLPRILNGGVDTNQASSNALTLMAGQGLENISPMVKAWELAAANETNLAISLVRNSGWSAAYGNGGYKPFLIPTRKPLKGQARSFPLDADLIDQVQSDIVCSLSKVSPRDWAGIAAGAQPLVQAGILRREEVRQATTGDHDWDRHFAEWAEENAAFSMLTHPKFQEMFGIELELLEMIKEAEGDPVMQGHYQDMLDRWKQMVMMQNQPPQPSPGGGGPQQMPDMSGNPSPPPPGSTVIPPGTTNGVSLPQMNLGPGSQGGDVGRPPIM